MTLSVGEGGLSVSKGGPVTQEGKEVVRWNATRHGISSPAPVVPGLEEPQDWQEHREGILESLSPVGHLEFTLAERVALISWRLHRVTRFETGVIAIAQEKIEEDIHDRRCFIASLKGERFAETHPIDIRGLARHRKQAHNALRRFSSHAPDKVLSGTDAYAVVRGVLDTVNKRTGKGIAEEELTLPGDLQDIHELSEFPAIKAAGVRKCLEVIAAHASLDPDELLEAAIEEARYEAAIAALKKEEMEQEVSREVAGRILPDGKTLEKVSRYEAHLSRQLYHALHELEALQTRRFGGDAPLARLDVQGLPAS
jgi:hypothetical protein